MKNHVSKIYLALALTSLLLIMSCPLPWTSMEDPGHVTEFEVDPQLPADKSFDVQRSFNGPFTYQTLFPVRVDITVELYAEDSTSEDGLRLVDPGMARVLLLLSKESGEEVYRGIIGPDGRISTTVYLPSASEDIILQLEADGYEKREVRIRDMVDYERIERTMSMLSSDTAINAKGMEPDSDGDGVPDAYDVDPNDENSAFEVNIPAKGALTVAFEDLYGWTDAGDADYNDFIAAYTITETHTDVQVEGEDEGVTEEMLSKLKIEVSGKEKIAGYDHIFGIRFNNFSGAAGVEGEYVDAGGTTRDLSMDVDGPPLNIEVFKSTSKAKGKSVSFTITFNKPQRLDSSYGKVVVDRPPYNPYLYVKNTEKDVHLVGEESLDGSYDPLMFMDGKNFPWALLVPTEWIAPAETQRIEEPYPRFTRWRESGGTLSRDWYLHDTPWEPEEPAKILELAADINSGSGSSSPQHLTEYDGALYFSADDGVEGRELWRYDSATDTANIVDNITGDSGSSDPQNFREYSSELYFQADDGTYGRELWKYSGSGDAQLVADINSDSANGNVAFLVEYASKLYFSAAATGFTSELYSLDGSGANKAPNSITTNPRYLSVLEASPTPILFYGAYDGFDRELWSYTDIGVSQTEEKIDVLSGSDSSDPEELMSYEGRLYFRAKDANGYYGLWEYEEGWTNAQEKIINASGSSNPTGFTGYGGAIYFSADGGNGDGIELWKYDGSGDPQQVYDINSSGSSNPAYMVEFGGKLYFVADDGEHGVELWSYDGISAPVLEKDLNEEGTEGSNPAYLTVYDNDLYFTADDGSGSGTELWRYVD